MQLDEFSYQLPETLIAQHPLADRSASRLMVVNRRSGSPPIHTTFAALDEWLDPGDLLVLNRSRVVPARLFLQRRTGAKIEMLFVRRVESDTVRAWLKSIRKLSPGETLTTEDGRVAFRFLEQVGEREAHLRLEPGGGDVDSVFDTHGHMPLPPYIRRPDRSEDRERYQTVFSRERGSVAAPTAGLHFDDDLLRRLEERGVEVRSIVLHVGPGTFSPLDHETVEDNELDEETVTIEADTVAAVSAARREGRRVIAVGTTVTRALEWAHARGWLEGPPEPRSGRTRLFIRPGHEFAVVDRLITNFHLPRSSLLLLVCAFLGRERTLECYREAVERRYRFYSYGDAMLVA